MENYNKKDFYISILKIAIPIALQHTALSFNSIIDNFMISKLGTNNLAALGSSNRFLQIFRLLIVGLGSANIILTAQYFAAKDKNGIKRILASGFLTNIIISALALLIYYAFNQKVVNSFSPNLEVREIAKSYLNIAIFTFIAKSIIFSYGYSLRGIGIVFMKTNLTILTTFLNIFLNYLFIYGSFGFPRLGIQGAALATLISESIAAILMLYITYKKDYEVAVKFSELFKVPKNFLIKYIKISLPLGLSNLLWSSGLLFYHNIFGSYGTNALAAYGLITPLELLLSNIFNGLANAATILIGKEIGKNNFSKAYDHAKSIMKIAILSSSIISFLVFNFSENIVNIYSNISKAASQDAILFLKIYSIFLVVRVFNLVSYAGILKSGGDSIFLFILGTSAMWLIGIPLANIAAYLFKLQSYKVYIIINSIEILIAITSFLRIRSKRWIRNLI